MTRTRAAATVALVFVGLLSLNDVAGEMTAVGVSQPSCVVRHAFPRDVEEI